MNNPARIVSVEEIWSEIKKAYNPTFIEKLIEIPDAHVYAFGGIVYDLSLGKQWKDLDLRVILDLPAAQRDQAVGDVLKEYADIIQKFEFPEGTVFRVKVSGGKDMIIDVGAANSLDVFKSDFRACAIFADLGSGEIVETAKDCIKDFENKIIRTLDDPEKQVEYDTSFLLFRALKLAAKSGFTIDPELEAVAKQRKDLIRRAVVEVTTYLRDNGKDSISEYFLGNIFGGLKAHPEVYVRLLEEYGFLEEMCTTIKEVLHIDPERAIVLEGDPAKLFEGLTIFEDKIATFIGIIAKAIGDNPEEVFERVKSAFALDTARSDGNEFVVDPNKVRYIA